jgi:hypothetical protein
VTPDRDIERILDRWLSGGPVQVSDRVMDVVADRIGRQRQRPAWRLQVWRFRTMPTPIRLIAVTAALLAVIGGTLLVGFGGIGGRPQPTPTQVPTAPPSAQPGFTCAEAGNPCAGKLSAEDHTSSLFRPTLTYGVPDQWQNTLDKARAYTLETGMTPAPTLLVMSQTAIPEQNAECTPARKAGVGNGVQDWVTFLTTHPGLDTSTPQPIAVGGYSGTRISFSVAKTWTQTCPDAVAPAVFVITDNGAVPQRVSWVDDQLSTWTILDVAGETVIVAVLSNNFPEVHANILAAADEVMNTFRFAP